MIYLISINSYRSSTSSGFANTWRTYRCKDRRHQQKLLREGLPSGDQWYIRDDGARSPVYSTNGIAPVNHNERRAALAHLDEVPMAPDPKGEEQ